MKKLLKIFSTYIISILFILGTSNISQASDHPTWQEIKKYIQNIEKFKKEINQFQ